MVQMIIETPVMLCVLGRIISCIQELHSTEIVWYWKLPFTKASKQKLLCARMWIYRINVIVKGAFESQVYNGC